MARKRREGLSISFFSFQDIMTSLSGIMIFIVLLLVLDITTVAVSQPRLVEEKSSRNEILSETKRLRSEVARIQSEIQTVELKSQQLADADPNAIKVQIAESEKTVQRLESKLTFRDDVQKQKGHQLKTVKRKVRTIDSEIVKLAQTLRKLQSKTKRSVVFALEDRDLHRNVILVECSAAEMLVKPLDSEAVPLVISERDPALRKKALATAIAAFPVHNHDFLVVIKPSAFTYSEEIVYFIKDMGYRVGSEPLEEERTCVRF